MSIFMNLLYGEMFGAWLWHLVIPLLASLFIWKFMSDNTPIQRILALIGVTMAASFVCHVILLLIIQSVSCSAIKNVGTIAYGSAIGSLIVGGMMCIPAFIQSMRLVVSQLYSHHYPLLTPELQRLQEQAVKMGSSVTGTPVFQVGGVYSESESETTKPQQSALLQKDYDYQTFREISIGASFWAAFGGAYGVGLGSLFAAKCS